MEPVNAGLAFGASLSFGFAAYSFHNFAHDVLSLLWFLEPPLDGGSDGKPVIVGTVLHKHLHELRDVGAVPDPGIDVHLFKAVGDGPAVLPDHAVHMVKREAAAQNVKPGDEDGAYVGHVLEPDAGSVVLVVRSAALQRIRLWWSSSSDFWTSMMA